MLIHWRLGLQDFCPHTQQQEHQQLNSYWEGFHIDLLKPELSTKVQQKHLRSTEEKSKNSCRAVSFLCWWSCVCEGVSIWKELVDRISVWGEGSFIVPCDVITWKSCSLPCWPHRSALALLELLTHWQMVICKCTLKVQHVLIKETLLKQLHHAGQLKAQLFMLLNWKLNLQNKRGGM